MSSSLESVRYTPGPLPKLQVLDQLLIPREKVYMDVNNVEDTWKVRRRKSSGGKITSASMSTIISAPSIMTSTTNDTTHKCSGTTLLLTTIDTSNYARFERYTNQYPRHKSLVYVSKCMIMCPGYQGYECARCPSDCHCGGSGLGGGC